MKINKNARLGAATPKRAEGTQTCLFTNPANQFITAASEGQRSIAELLAVGAENGLTSRQLVRVVIQHFSKNTVISMVLGHPNSEITCIPPS